MDLSQLLTMPNMVISLAIFGLVFVMKKLTEVVVAKTLNKDLSKYKFWKELVLPTLPLITGGLLMLIPQVPVPLAFAAGLGAKFVFGVGLGLLSGFMYRIAKKMLVERLGEESEETPYDK